MTPGRVRLLSMAAIVVAAGIAALAWSQTWYTFVSAADDVVVGGDVAGGALLPLALASLALVAALAIAGPFFRVVLGVLDALLGVCVVVVAAWSLSDPVRASVQALTQTTGVENLEPLREITEHTGTTMWPVVGLIGGMLMMLTGLAVALTSRAWPASGGRYTRSRVETPEGDAVNDWDALSEGDDPTATPR